MPGRSIRFIIAQAIVIFLVLVLGFAIGKLTNHKCSSNHPASAFVNKSSSGYYYDTDTLSFYSSSDRNLALEALVEQLKHDGYTFSRTQLDALSDEIVINILDLSDDETSATIESQLVLVLDPSYRSVLKVVLNAQKNNQFNNNEERQMVYDLLVKYFVAVGTPIQQPLDKFSDAVLIHTFRTLTPPTISDTVPKSTSVITPQPTFSSLSSA